jgi:hypothetical protein
MTANYVLLETVTVGAAGATSVAFNNIPQTGYTDLVVKVSSRSSVSGANDYPIIKFNGSTSSYSLIGLAGNGSTVSTYTDTSIYGIGAGGTQTASTFGNTEYYIPNYTGSTNKYLSIDGVNENNGTTATAAIIAGLWSNTAAITSFTLEPYNAGQIFVQYSTFSLYGIAAVGTTPTIAPKATGGDIIQTDGTYWYHAFLSSGTFTPSVGLSADALIIAGGGSGGYGGGGGAGGAGGLCYAPSASLTTTSYSITVGAGGATTFPSSGSTNGSNSVFNSITANGGGGGGANSGGDAGRNGGSGGGADANTSSAAGGTSTQTSGTGYTGYGNAGGAGGNNGSLYSSGGGGGAGAAGGSAVAQSTGGAGGNGLNTWSSWASATGTGVSGYYAGGGGGNAATGGAAGLGGGGTVGQNGTANTGGGGGGASGQSGGSGIVIIRYLVA